MKKTILVIGLLTLIMLSTVVSAKNYEDMTLERLEIKQDKIEARSSKVYEKLQFATKPRKIARLTKRLNKLDSIWAELDFQIKLKTPPVCEQVNCGNGGGSGIFT
jgi:peptidoglycan hydrolase CwlO-like protein